MKKTICTFLFIFSLSAVSVSVYAEDMPITEGEQQVWYFNNEDGVEDQMFDPVSIPNGQLAPIGSQGSAPSVGTPKLSVAGISQWFMQILAYAVQLILALSLVSFLYGIFRLVFLDASNEEGRNKARKFMLWGIVALFVMVSVWGLVNVLRSSFFGGGGLIIPTFR